MQGLHQGQVVNRRSGSGSSSSARCDCVNGQIRIASNKNRKSLKKECNTFMEIKGWLPCFFSLLRACIGVGTRHGPWAAKRRRTFLPNRVGFVATKRVSREAQENTNTKCVREYHCLSQACVAWWPFFPSAFHPGGVLQRRGGGGFGRLRAKLQKRRRLLLPLHVLATNTHILCPHTHTPTGTTAMRALLAARAIMTRFTRSQLLWLTRIELAALLVIPRRSCYIRVDS